MSSAKATSESGAITVSRLRPGDEARGVFGCTRKDRLVTRSGTAYLALELRDRTGTIAARAFREVDMPVRHNTPRIIEIAGVEGRAKRVTRFDWLVFPEECEAALE